MTDIPKRPIQEDVDRDLDQIVRNLAIAHAREDFRRASGQIEPDILRFVENLAVADARRDHTADLAARRVALPSETPEVATEPASERP